ncbi:MAG: DUF2007 domain-containing protein [Phycisphaeraceae bacterium]|nr:DUF2007 domain-containing protein [Phycisphaeraceae bacterium]
MSSHASEDPDDHTQSVTLVTVQRAFEAEAIAAALRERGINAQAIGTTMGAVLSNQIAPTRVMVLADQAEEARVVLDRIQAEASKIDWSQVDFPEDDPPPSPPRGRWLWTLTVLLVPLGLIVMSFGIQRRDVMIQALGGTALVAAIVIAFVMLNTERAPADRR